MKTKITGLALDALPLARCLYAAMFLALCSLLLAPCFPTQAQQPKKVPRIGYLSGSSPSADAARIEAFRQGLRELGYLEGKNILIEYRYAEEKLDRLFDLATEMVRLNPDFIVVSSTGFGAAAKRATSTIPIVVIGGDVVGAGLVSSLARPGGNVTGLTAISTDLSGKRFELVKDVVPKLSRVGGRLVWRCGRRRTKTNGDCRPCFGHSDSVCPCASG